MGLDKCSYFFILLLAVLLEDGEGKIDEPRSCTESCIKQHPVIDFDHSLLGAMCADGSRRMYNNDAALICTKCCPGYTWDDDTKCCSACGNGFTNDEATVFANSCDKPVKLEVVDPPLQPVASTPAVTLSLSTTASTVPTKATMTAQTTVGTTDGSTSVVMRTNPEFTDWTQTVPMKDQTKSKKISTDSDQCSTICYVLIFGVAAIFPVVLVLVAVFVQRVRQKGGKAPVPGNDEEAPLARWQCM